MSRRRRARRAAAMGVLLLAAAVPLCWTAAFGRRLPVWISGSGYRGWWLDRHGAYRDSQGRYVLQFWPDPRAELPWAAWVGPGLTCGFQKAKGR